MDILKKFCVIGVCLFLLIPTLSFGGDERESCHLCGMWIDQYQRTACKLIHDDDKTEHTCGVACMLRIAQANGVTSFRSILVKDWKHGTEVDARQAWYSIGSLLIPDMLPNYIAFADRKEAEAFAAEKGGTVLDFIGAMDSISPRGMTQPFRIRQAVTPGKGSFGVGVAYAYILRDSVMIGTDSEDPDAFMQNNPAQPRAPKEMKVQMQSLVMNYGITDRLAMQMNLPYFERRSETLVRQGSQVNQVTSKDDGIGDLAGEIRYNLWRSDFYDKFFTLLGGVTFPTGDFDSTRSYNAMLQTNLISTGPGMQQGTDVPTYLGGLLYSHKWESLWFHAQGLYRFLPENSSDYKFGDEIQGGVAIHYTPHYDVMLGIEWDISETRKNEDRNIKIGNTGGTRSNLAFVVDWRIFNAFGGNFNLRGSVGLPVYEDLNSQTFLTPMGKPFTQVQLGEGFFANLVINFNTRFGQL